MNGADSLRSRLDGIQRQGLLVGIAGAALCLFGGFFSPQQFLQSYLVGFLFWTGLAAGSTAIVMLHHLVGGRWGFVIRRTLESATRTLPLMAVLSLPIVLGIRHIYVWAGPEGHELGDKALYLNIPFFTVRTVLYFGAWILLAYFLSKISAEQDQTGAASTVRRLQLLSGPGLLIYGLTMTFASVDWVMSLDPHWFSTIFGVIFMVGQALSTLAFVIAALLLLSRYEPLSKVVTPAHFHDLGNLMLAFVMLWAYVGLSQFLIIWSGNLPEEIPWYITRIRGGWQPVALILVTFHFAVPFLLLLSRGLKKNPQRVASLAVLILVMRLVDLFWIVSPAFHPAGFHIHWLDVAIPVAIGGLWVSTFARQLKQRPLLPVRDPRF